MVIVIRDWRTVRGLLYDIIIGSLEYRSLVYQISSAAGLTNEISGAFPMINYRILCVYTVSLV